MATRTSTRAEVQKKLINMDRSREKNIAERKESEEYPTNDKKKEG